MKIPPLLIGRNEACANIVTTYIPGAIALAPFYILVYGTLPFHKLWMPNTDFILHLILYTFFSIFLGSVISILGGWLEYNIEKDIFKETPNFQSYWKDYLMLRFEKDNEPFIISYIQQFVYSLKFELNGCIACTISGLGFAIIFVLILFNCISNEYYWGVFLIIIILLLIAKYLHSEINDSVFNLHQLREDLSKRGK